MKGYKCENLDKKLKLRVFVGSILLAVILLIFLVSCVVYIPRMVSNSFVGSGVVLLFLCPLLGVINTALLIQYIGDIKLKDNKLEEIVGTISLVSKDMLIIEKDDSDVILFVIPKCVNRTVEFREKLKVKILRTKKSQLVEEVTFLDK